MRARVLRGEPDLYKHAYTRRTGEPTGEFSPRSRSRASGRPTRLPPPPTQFFAIAVTAPGAPKRSALRGKSPAEGG